MKCWDGDNDRNEAQRVTAGKDTPSEWKSYRN